jgi:endo-1,4-beta-xylanase
MHKKNRIVVLFTALICFIAAELYAQNDISLKDVFKDDFLIGTAVNRFQLSGGDNLAVSIIKDQFNTITAENELKWEPVHPRLDVYNFEPADLFVEFGKKNNMFMVGHTLLWHNQTPQWVFKNDQGESADRETLLKRMHEHIQKIAGRYKGQINGWDVVNEALDEDGALRQSQWMKIIGEDYIAKAFQYANEADPEAELYYNDFSLENKPKRDGAIRLIKKLQSQGIKIDGVGLQGHYKMDWPSAAQLDSTIKDFAALGIKVMITELDIDVLPYKDISAEITLTMENQEKYDPYKDGLPDSAQKSLAQRYYDLFKVLVQNKNTIDRVTFWGVTDKESWLNYWPIPGRKNYPLLFDRDGKPKPAFFSVLKTAGINSNKLNDQ